jgi:hypothetical protein
MADCEKVHEQKLKYFSGGFDENEFRNNFGKS